MRQPLLRLLSRGLLCSALAAGALATAVTAKQGEENKNRGNATAKNVIVLISDGWGYNHVDAASYYQYGTYGKQVYEHFPTKTAMSTHECEGPHPDCTVYGYDTVSAWNDFNYVKTYATDSASAATAMATGQKTYNGAIGVDVNENPLQNILEYAEVLGKATGVVTSVQFSHATPAGFVAHNASRNNYADIANEMIYDSAIDVIMGCGAPDFDNSGNQPFSGDPKYVGGGATWTDITDDLEVIGADADGDGPDADDVWTVIRDRSDFLALANGMIVPRVLGIPKVYTTLQQSRAGDGYVDPYVVPSTVTIPTLEEMTQAALNVLDNDQDGFVLMVEGGAVDWASHGNQSGRMIEEQIDFNRSVEAVVQWVQKNSNWGETLVIVTGDHECGYLTGPGSDPNWMGIVNNGQGNLPGMEWHSGSHTNSLIPFFAKGDAARLFKAYADEDDIARGRYIDNTEIGQIIFDVLK